MPVLICIVANKATVQYLGKQILCKIAVNVCTAKEVYRYIEISVNTLLYTGEY